MITADTARMLTDKAKISLEDKELQDIETQIVTWAQAGCHSRTFPLLSPSIIKKLEAVGYVVVNHAGSYGYLGPSTNVSW